MKGYKMDKDTLEKLIAEYNFEADRKFQEEHIRKLNELLKLKKLIVKVEDSDLPRTGAIKNFLVEARGRYKKLLEETSDKMTTKEFIEILKG